MGVENFYIEKGSAESASPGSICLDVNSSIIFSSGCFVVKAVAFRRLIEVSALLQHHGILLPGVSQRYREFHYVLGECIHLWDSVESGSV